MAQTFKFFMKKIRKKHQIRNEDETTLPPLASAPRVVQPQSCNFQLGAALPSPSPPLWPLPYHQNSSAAPYSHDTKEEVNQTKNISSDKREKIYFLTNNMPRLRPLRFWFNEAKNTEKPHDVIIKSPRLIIVSEGTRGHAERLAGGALPRVMRTLVDHVRCSTEKYW